MVSNFGPFVAKALRNLADWVDPPALPAIEDLLRQQADWLARPLFRFGRDVQAPAPSLQQPDR